MKSTLLTVLTLTFLHSRVQAVSPCSWRFSWSDQGPPLPPGVYIPPNSPACGLFVSDSLELVNAGNESQLAFRVITEAAFNACNTSALVLFPGVRNVSVPADSDFSLTLSRGASNPWTFLLNEDVYMIGEARNGTCLKLSFSIQPDSSRDCSIVRTNGECGVFPPTTPTLSTFPTSTTVTTVTNETMGTSVRTQTTEMSTGTQESTTTIPTTTTPGSIAEACILDVNTSYCDNNAATVMTLRSRSIQFLILDYDVTIFRVSSHENTTHCNASLLLPGSLMLPRNINYVLSLSPGNSPFNFSVEETVNLLVGTNGPCLCIRLAVILTADPCLPPGRDNSKLIISVSVVSVLIVLVIVIVGGAIGGGGIWYFVRTQRKPFWLKRDVMETEKSPGDYTKFRELKMSSISSDT